MKKLIFSMTFVFFSTLNCLERTTEKLNFSLSAKECIVEVVNECVGNIHVSTHNENTILIDILKESSSKECLQNLQVKIDKTDQKILISAINNNDKKEKTWFEWFSFTSYTVNGKYSVNGKSDRIDLKIKIPKNCALNIDLNNGNTELENIEKAISIKSNLGSITVKNAGSSVDIKSNNGTLNLDTIKGHLNIKNNLGSVNIKDINEGLVAKVTNGNVDIRNAKESLNVYVTNGSINLHQASVQDSGQIDFKTTTGSINLRLSSAQNATINAKTTIGSILINNKKVSSFKIGNSYRGSLGPGIQSKAKIFLKTITGSIEVNTL